ncbi:MAG: amino acid permease [Inquilinus sp.]|nr:amino acid permease [Inquilinus sp.]
MAEQEPHLRRSLSLPLLTLYGLGTTIGAGIFALIGKVAGNAGVFAPVSFLVASLLAAFSALSFAELSARFPRAAGEAVYVREGLQSHRLALAVGLLVALSGTVSAAAIVNGAVGYVHDFVGLPGVAIIVGIVLVLGLTAAWGIRESVTLASLFTVIEIGGVLLVIWAGWRAAGHAPGILPPTPTFDVGIGAGILAGAVLAFYAFLGFEDMVNVAEEVKDVRRTLPLAILLTMAVTALLYVLLSMAAVRAVPPAELAASAAPMTLVFQRGTGWSGEAISLIAIFAILNGALIQMIMASRVLYGLSAQGQLPALLGMVNPRTRTPLPATVLVIGAVLALALLLPIEPLARTTSLLVLTVFSLVNLSLWRLKRREQGLGRPGMVPRWVPAVGVFVSVAFIVLEALRLWQS